MVGLGVSQASHTTLEEAIRPIVAARSVREVDPSEQTTRIDHSAHERAFQGIDRLDRLRVETCVLPK